jgi:hypothetical protein
MFCALAASACTLPADDTGEIPADEERLVTGAGTFAVELDEPNQGLIRCTLRVHHPHHSRHEPENANVVADTTCTSVVPRIDMNITLTRDGLAVGHGGEDRPNRVFLQANASALCVAGIYRGHARASIYFPPGYSPNPQTINAASAEVRIPCTVPAVTLNEASSP